jgi:N-methylhydantoinase A
MLILGVDTGGTFTDFVLQSENGLETFKLPSTPDDPSRAILKGLAHFFGNQLPLDLEVVHGSTVGTNAFLERKGARTALVTTYGFEDVLFIGRQNRPRLYDLNVTRPLEIIPRARIFGVKERMLFDGTVLKALGHTVGRRLRKLIREHDIESVAVCLLHSYANDSHEQKIKQGLSGTGIPITLSSEILPEFREYERLTTTLINAYLAPEIVTYIQKLTEQLGEVVLHIQQSNGGVLPAEDIGRRAIYTVLSGPAGGVHGAHQLAQEMGIERVITFDMGGTSTDVSLCDKEPTLTREHQIDGYPIRIQVMDIHTVGAGGGSLAKVDSGGLLKVGPESAGARPGPICYDVGGQQLTVTDANLFLGRLLPHHFMDGAMLLEKDKVNHAMESLAKEMDLDPVTAALGIIRIVNASMAKAIRAVSLERGYDPQEFALFAFGGASGLHCCELATELSIKKIVIPARAGILSAQGMVFADPTLDYMQTLFLHGDGIDSPVLSREFEKLVNHGLKEARKLKRVGDENKIQQSSFLNLRYQGQSYELCIPYVKNFKEIFHQHHELKFGYRLDKTPLELVSIQCSIKVIRAKYSLPRQSSGISGRIKPIETGTIHFEDGPYQVPVYDRKMLIPGYQLTGPVLVIDDYITVLLPDQFTLQVDELLNLLIEKD